MSSRSKLLIELAKKASEDSEGKSLMQNKIFDYFSFANLESTNNAVTHAADRCYYDTLYIFIMIYDFMPHVFCLQIYDR